MPTLQYNDCLSLSLSLSLSLFPSISLFLSLSLFLSPLPYSSIHRPNSISLLVPPSLSLSVFCIIHLFSPNASPKFIGAFPIGAFAFPPRDAHHPVRYSAYMIRCNYNQVNNCYDRSVCEGVAGEPVTNAARFVRCPAPITLCQRTEEGRTLPTIRLQLGISIFLVTAIMPRMISRSIKLIFGLLYDNKT